ncbi:hypothetical protein DVH24_024181 [Malus domestica]|uniref:Leucine-rich repeat-containing N-terminal plant-type domain-containing protein n=1 Tax=Malus domestica TaxID=3750 RepID=A0A498JI53_MALDO|nr:hypothetical protein DVH24_024181 [Malus domestica]
MSIVGENKTPSPHPQNHESTFSFFLLLPSVSLDLSRCNLSSQIPPQICHLSSLIHLNLSGNAFHGPLQPAIFELYNLRILGISHNNFKSDFPPGILKLSWWWCVVGTCVVV